MSVTMQFQNSINRFRRNEVIACSWYVRKYKNKMLKGINLFADAYHRKRTKLITHIWMSYVTKVCRKLMS